MSKSAVEVLTEARELITPPERWTRGWYARDAEGREVDATDPNAVCFCSIGALCRAEGRFEPGVSPVATEYLIEATGSEDTFGILDFNDGKLPDPWSKPRHAPARHRKVLAAFDRAIELANQEGK